MSNFGLLFVCTGNTCRSPMAQVIAERSVARRGWGGVEIRSAGVSAFPGGEASEGARLATDRSGLSLEGHTTKALDSELVDWASLILTMGPHHADAAEALGGGDKVWMLSAFAEGSGHARGPGVPDPFGGDTQTYVDCLETLEVYVEAALERVEADFLGQKEEEAP